MTKLTRRHSIRPNLFKFQINQLPASPGLPAQFIESNSKISSAPDGTSSVASSHPNAPPVSKSHAVSASQSRRVSVLSKLSKDQSPREPMMKHPTVPTKLTDFVDKKA